LSVCATNPAMMDRLRHAKLDFPRRRGRPYIHRVYLPPSPTTTNGAQIAGCALCAGSVLVRAIIES